MTTSHFELNFKKFTGFHPHRRFQKYIQFETFSTNWFLTYQSKGMDALPEAWMDKQTFYNSVSTTKMFW